MRNNCLLLAVMLLSMSCCAVQAVTVNCIANKLYVSHLTTSNVLVDSCNNCDVRLGPALRVNSIRFRVNCDNVNLTITDVTASTSSTLGFISIGTLTNVGIISVNNIDRPISGGCPGCTHYMMSVTAITFKDSSSYFYAYNNKLNGWSSVGWNSRSDYMFRVGGAFNGNGGRLRFWNNSEHTQAYGWTSESCLVDVGGTLSNFASFEVLNFSTSHSVPAKKQTPFSRVVKLRGSLANVDLLRVGADLDAGHSMSSMNIGERDPAVMALEVVGSISNVGLVAVGNLTATVSSTNYKYSPYLIVVGVGGNVNGVRLLLENIDGTVSFAGNTNAVTLTVVGLWLTGTVGGSSAVKLETRKLNLVAPSLMAKTALRVGAVWLTRTASRLSVSISDTNITIQRARVVLSHAWIHLLNEESNLQLTRNITIERSVLEVHSIQTPAGSDTGQVSLVHAWGLFFDTALPASERFLRIIDSQLRLGYRHNDTVLPKFTAFLTRTVQDSNIFITRFRMSSLVPLGLAPIDSLHVPIICRPAKCSFFVSYAGGFLTGQYDVKSSEIDTQPIWVDWKNKYEGWWSSAMSAYDNMFGGPANATITLNDNLIAGHVLMPLPEGSAPFALTNSLWLIGCNRWPRALKREFADLYNSTCPLCYQNTGDCLLTRTPTFFSRTHSLTSRSLTEGTDSASRSNTTNITVSFTRSITHVSKTHSTSKNPTRSDGNFSGSASITVDPPPTHTANASGTASRDIASPSHSFSHEATRTPPSPTQQPTLSHADTLSHEVTESHEITPPVPTPAPPPAGTTTTMPGLVPVTVPPAMTPTVPGQTAYFPQYTLPSTTTGAGTPAPGAPIIILLQDVHNKSSLVEIANVIQQAQNAVPPISASISIVDESLGTFVPLQKLPPSVTANYYGDNVTFTSSNASAIAEVLRIVEFMPSAAALELNLTELDYAQVTVKDGNMSTAAATKTPLPLSAMAFHEGPIALVDSIKLNVSRGIDFELPLGRLFYLPDNISEPTPTRRRLAIGAGLASGLPLPSTVRINCNEIANCSTVGAITDDHPVHAIVQASDGYAIVTVSVFFLPHYVPLHSDTSVTVAPFVLRPGRPFSITIPSNLFVSSTPISYRSIRLASGAFLPPTLTFDPPATLRGTYPHAEVLTIEVRAKDQFEYAVRQLQLNFTNAPPECRQNITVADNVIALAPALQQFERTVDLSALCIDAVDGDLLSFEVAAVNLPNWLRFDVRPGGFSSFQTLVLSGAAPRSSLGVTYWLNITVRDTASHTQLRLPLHISDNPPPVCVSNATLLAALVQPVPALQQFERTVDLSALCTDDSGIANSANQLLSFTVNAVNLPNWLRFEVRQGAFARTLLLSGEPPRTALGHSYTLNISVSDVISTVLLSIPVHVLPNTPPRLERPLPNMTVTPGAEEPTKLTVRISEHFVDPQDDKLVPTKVQLKEGTSDAAAVEKWLKIGRRAVPPTFTLEAHPDEDVGAQVIEIEVEVTDALGATATAVCTVTVELTEWQKIRQAFIYASTTLGSVLTLIGALWWFPFIVNCFRKRCIVIACPVSSKNRIWKVPENARTGTAEFGERTKSWWANCVTRCLLPAYVFDNMTLRAPPEGECPTWLNFIDLQLQLMPPNRDKNWQPEMPALTFRFWNRAGFLVCQFDVEYTAATANWDHSRDDDQQQSSVLQPQRSGDVLNAAFEQEEMRAEMSEMRSMIESLLGGKAAATVAASGGGDRYSPPAALQQATRTSPGQESLFDDTPGAKSYLPSAHQHVEHEPLNRGELDMDDPYAALAGGGGSAGNRNRFHYRGAGTPPLSAVAAPSAAVPPEKSVSDVQIELSGSFAGANPFDERPPPDSVGEEELAFL